MKQANVPSLDPRLLQLGDRWRDRVRQRVVGVNPDVIEGIPPANVDLFAVVTGIDDRPGKLSADLANDLALILLAPGDARKLGADAKLLDPLRLGKTRVMYDPVTVRCKPVRPGDFIAECRANIPTPMRAVVCKIHVRFEHNAQPQRVGQRDGMAFREVSRYLPAYEPAPVEATAG